VTAKTATIERSDNVDWIRVIFKILESFAAILAGLCDRAPNPALRSQAESLHASIGDALAQLDVEDKEAQALAEGTAYQTAGKAKGRNA
jgi:hypothetical protein